MTDTSQGLGWWLASDGRWYPPPLHPEHRSAPELHRSEITGTGEPCSQPAMSATMTGWTLKRLPYGGRCLKCHRGIAKKEEGWHNPSAPPNKKVICSACWSGAGTGGLSEPATSHPSRVGGSSALRDSAKKGRQKRTWQRGAAGEYLMGLTLAEQLTSEQVVLVDLAVPGSQANIDFLVVSASGVWLIDAKK